VDTAMPGEAHMDQVCYITIVRCFYVKMIKCNYMDVFLVYD